MSQLELLLLSSLVCLVALMLASIIVKNRLKDSLSSNVKAIFSQNGVKCKLRSNIKSNLPRRLKEFVVFVGRT